MKQIILTLFLIFIVSISPTAAQSTALVHINQPFYVSGEVIWYKLYLPKDFPAGPKVITVSMFDRSGQLLDQSHLRREEKTSVYGFYRIPYEWKSDIYRLVFSGTEEDQHRPITLAEVFVPIYDDFSGHKEVPPTAGRDRNEYSSQNLESGALRIEISTDQKHYAPRTTARLHIEITNEDGTPIPADLSVSITDQQLCKIDDPLFSTLTDGRKQVNFPQLEEDITLRGTMFEPDGQSILPRGNIGAYLVDQKQFIYAKADEEARFTLDLPAVHGPCPIHIGGFIPEELLVTLNQKVDLSNPSPQRLPFPPQIINYLEWSRKRKLIYQLYGRLEQTFTASLPPQDNGLEDADSPVILDEYETFADIPTLVKELLIPIRFRSRKDDSYEARVFDPTLPSRKFHSKGPLFIVDGHLTRNADYIADLDITKVERFDLYFDSKKSLRLFGPMARNGLVMIHSRNRDIEVPESDRKNFFTINCFQAKVEYPVQLRSVEEREVLLRPALFWAPSIMTNEQGEAILSVPLSDDHTRFRVEVVAQGANGDRGVGEAFIMVDKKSE